MVETIRECSTLGVNPRDITNEYSAPCGVVTAWLYVHIPLPWLFVGLCLLSRPTLGTPHANGAVNKSLQQATEVAPQA